MLRDPGHLLRTSSLDHEGGTIARGISEDNRLLARFYYACMTLVKGELLISEDSQAEIGRAHV